MNTYLVDGGILDKQTLEKAPQIRTYLLFLCLSFASQEIESKKDLELS